MSYDFNEETSMAMDNSSRDSAKTILVGIPLVAGGVLFWLLMVGNPLHDLALTCRARTAPGYITDAWEETESGDEGGTHWFHGVAYTYTLPDGREISQSSGSGSGRLRDDLRDLEQPYPIEVEYLPDDPQVSRVKGSGSSTVLEWLWRKLGLGGLLLAFFVGPGVVLIRNGCREFWSRWPA